jgi:hypothetical protein
LAGNRSVISLGKLFKTATFQMHVSRLNNTGHWL